MLHRPGPKEPAQLLAIEQAVTAGWVNFGPEIDFRDFTILTVFNILDINDSTNVRIRALAKLQLGTDADAFSLPIKNTTASVVQVEPHYYEFNVDADQKMVLEFVSDAGIPYVQLQIQAGVVGAVAGDLTGYYLRSRAGGLA